MPAINHTHRYRKVEQGKSKRAVYACDLPNCSHFITPEFLPGKECVCYICGSTFVMTYFHRKFRRPHCMNCRLRKKASNQELVSQLVSREPEHSSPTSDELIKRFKERFK